MNLIQLFNTSQRKGLDRFKEISYLVQKTLTNLHSIYKRIKGKCYTSVNITQRLNYNRTQDPQRKSIDYQGIVIPRKNMMLQNTSSNELDNLINS